MHTAAVIVITAAVGCKCALWSSGYAGPVHVHVVWQQNKESPVIQESFTVLLERLSSWLNA